MKSSTFLRIASVITLLYCAGHTAGMPWTPATGPAEQPLLEAMKAHSFDALGSQRTYWDFYFGFGVIISVYLLVQAVVLWQLGSLARTQASQLRPITAAFFVGFMVNAFLAWKYFFAIPVIMTVAICVCIGLAFVLAGPATSRRSAPAATK